MPNKLKRKKLPPKEDSSRIKADFNDFLEHYQGYKSFPFDLDLPDGEHVDIKNQVIVVKDKTLHNDDGPAMILETSSIWFHKGRHHRVDGPAVEYLDGSCYWWIDGEIYRDMNEWGKAAGIFDTEEFVMLKLEYGDRTYDD